jgi:hypothetical protein
MVGQAPARCFHPAFFVKNIIGPSQPFDVAIPAFRESQRKRPLRGLIPRPSQGNTAIAMTKSAAKSAPCRVMLPGSDSAPQPSRRELTLFR